MKILFYNDRPDVQSTLLTWTLAEELRLRGHYVVWGKPTDVPKGYFDWVRVSGADDAWNAVHFARKIGAKVHVHLEGVAYWRVGLDPATSWGYDADLCPDEIQKWQDHYRAWMSAAYEADSCTVNGVRQVAAIENGLFGGRILPNCHLLACGADARYALALPDWPKQDYFVTVSRLEPNKKVFMIAEALALLPEEHRLPWAVIGYGAKNQVDTLLQYCKLNNIKLHLRHCFGAEKWRLIKQARLMIQGWSGIPPAEGLLCRVPVVSFDHADIREMYDDSVTWAKDNDPCDMADFLCETGKGHMSFDISPADALAELMGGRLYACTQEQAAERFEKILMGDTDNG